jgi:hypothetical protein
MTNDVEFCKTCFHGKSSHLFNQTDYLGCMKDSCSCEKYILGEIRVTSLTGGSKGTKAAQFSLVPPYPLTLLAKLYNFGVAKYAAHNWRNGYDWSKSYDAAMRHMTQFWEGEDIDEETGTPHVICAVFHMFALAQFMKDFPEYDDRFKVAEKFTSLKDMMTKTEYDIGIEDIDLKFPTGNEVAGVDFDVEDFGGVGLLGEAELAPTDLSVDKFNSESPCGFTWVSPMRRIWVQCEHRGYHDRHENGRSFVTVGCEDAISIPHRWLSKSEIAEVN